FAGHVFGGPAVPGDQLSQASGILDVDRLHARDIGSTEFVGGRKFRPDPQVFGSHRDEFAAQHLIDHGTDSWRRSERISSIGHSSIQKGSIPSAIPSHMALPCTRKPYLRDHPLHFTFPPHPHRNVS